jgi:peptide/nickel transport system permease protein
MIGKRALEARSRWRKPKPALVAGLILLAGLAVISIAAPLIAPYDPTFESTAGLAADGSPLDPGSTYLLGTDPKGRDLLSRLIFGGRVTFFASVVAVGAATVIGLIIGLAAASSNRRIGGLLMRATDLGLAIPGLLLAAAITAVLGRGLVSLTIALAAVFWAPLARVTYGQAIIVKERQFVVAGRALGARWGFLLIHHVLPHVLPIVAAYAALSVGWAALFESALGFLGVGVQEPTSSIGAMLGCCLVFYRQHPGLILFPTLYLGLLVTATTLVGEALRRPREVSRGTGR